MVAMSAEWREVKVEWGDRKCVPPGDTRAGNINGSRSERKSSEGVPVGDLSCGAVPEGKCNTEKNYLVNETQRRHLCCGLL